MSTSPSVPAERDWALWQLRRLTVGAAIAGLLGTAGFGVLAALTYAGQPSTAGSTDPIGADPTAPPADQSGGVPDTQAQNPSGGQLVPAPRHARSSSGGGQVTTGGSR